MDHRAKTRHHVSQWEGYPSNPAGRRLLVCTQVSGNTVILPLPHAQRPHGGSDLHLEPPAHLLLPHHCHPSPAQTEGEMILI